MTTRTSIPRWRRLRGSAPATSARPPVFRNGATSDATKSTLSRPSREAGVILSAETTVFGAFGDATALPVEVERGLVAFFPPRGLGSGFNVVLLAAPSARFLRTEPLGRVDPVVDVGEDVVLCFNRNQILLVYLSLLQLFVKSGKANDVLVESAGGIGNCGPRRHNKGPVGRLSKHQLARCLFERAHGQRIRCAPVPSRQLDHALAGSVDVPPGPGVGLVQPLFAVALEPPGRRA